MAYHGPVYGLDAEIKNKMSESYDHSTEVKIQDWMEKKIGETVPGGFAESLKSGVVLCKLANHIRPGAVGKIGTGSAPFVQMENISNYLKACEAMGLKATDLFQTVDLFEAKNMNAVLNNLQALKRLSP